MQISERLKFVADFVTEGMIVADIGTDHGYIPITLVEGGKNPYAIGMDINSGPLERAKEHINSHNLSDKIKIRQSDGVKELEVGEAESIVIAGMGGALIVKILSEGREIIDSAKELVLSPHTESFLVRKYLIDNGFDIVREGMIYDMKKFYTVIKAVKAHNFNIKSIYDMDENNYIYGKLLIEEKSPVFIKYLEYEKSKLDYILSRIQNPKDIKGIKIRERLQGVKRILN